MIQVQKVKSLHNRGARAPLGPRIGASTQLMGCINLLQHTNCQIARFRGCRGSAPIRG